MDHSNYGIGGLVQIAEAFYNQGVDLYSYGPRGRDDIPGLAQVLQTWSHITLYNKFPPNVSSNDSFWRDTGFPRGSLCLLKMTKATAGGYHIGYNHFVKRMKLNLTELSTVVAKNPFDGYYFHWGLGSLSHFGTC